MHEHVFTSIDKLRHLPMRFPRPALMISEQGLDPNAEIYGEHP